MNVFELNSIIYLIITAVLIIIACKRLRIPAPPVLLIVGIILQRFELKGVSFFTIHPFVLKLLTIIILPIIIFDIFSRIRNKKIDTLGSHAIQTSTFLFPFSIIIVGSLCYLIFTELLFFKIAMLSGFDPLISAILISLILVASSDFDIPLKKKTKTQKEFLYQESIISSGIAILFIFSIINILQKDSLLVALIDIFSGVGIGFIMSFTIFRLLNLKWSSRISNYILLLSSIIVYLISEIISANPVFAVAAFGFFFGNTALKTRKRLEEFSSGVVNISEMIIFLIIPIAIGFIFSFKIMILAFLVILAFSASRYFAINCATSHDFSRKERVALSLFIPKGTITIITLIFLIISQIDLVIDAYSFIIMIVIMSLVISMIISIIWGKITK